MIIELSFFHDLWFKDQVHDWLFFLKELLDYIWDFNAVVSLVEVASSIILKI